MRVARSCVCCVKGHQVARIRFQPFVHVKAVRGVLYWSWRKVDLTDRRPAHICPFQRWGAPGGQPGGAGVHVRRQLVHTQGHKFLAAQIPYIVIVSIGRCISYGESAAPVPGAVITVADSPARSFIYSQAATIKVCLQVCGIAIQLNNVTSFSTSLPAAHSWRLPVLSSLTGRLYAADWHRGYRQPQTGRCG